MKQFMVASGDQPFAYLQCYDPDAWQDNGFGALPSGTRGIDQFIGEPSMLDRGHGSALIRAFIEGLLEAGAPRVVTDRIPPTPVPSGLTKKPDFASIVWSTHPTAAPFSWYATNERLFSA